MVVRLELLLTLSLLLAAMPAHAQGMEAGYMQTMSPSSAIGPEQDSLLPPEVVPLDPSTANTLSESQAQSRQASMASGNVPGLTSEPSPKDMRQQAFGQLYGNQTTLPPNAMNQVWRAGQQPMQQPMQQAGMMPPGMNSLPLAASQPGGPNYQMADNQQMQQGYIAQSQTLTGSSQNQPQQVNTRRGGLSNVLNYASAFGAGALTSGFWSGNPWLGAGMFGMTMTGMGVRNNSRF